jgi:hypothetical protein
MLLIKKRSFVVALALASAGMPAVGRPPAPTHGIAGPPPVIGVAVLPERARVRRRSRFASVRVIRLWILRLRREALAATRAHRESLHSRLPLRESYARGPPRGRGFLPAEAGRVTPPGRRQAFSRT